MEILKVIILGIVEGITEWLPVSSTAHMLIVDEFIKLDVSMSFKDVFLLVIQLGAILAVFTTFFNELNPFNKHLTGEKRRDIYDLWIKIVVGCLPVGIAGLLLDNYFDAIFNGSYLIYTITLIGYGIAFIVLENAMARKTFTTRTMKSLSLKEAFLMGLFQCLALIPGTSRSGSTVIGGLLLGISREVGCEFTFLMAMPVIGAASFLKLIQHGLVFSGIELLYLAVGVVTAYITSVLSIRFLLNYVKRDNFKGFGVYRIVLGLFILVVFVLL